MRGWLKSVKAAGWVSSWRQEWLTQGKCSTVPLCGGCEVLQALCCGGGAGGWCQHELCSGQSSLLPAGPGSTSYTSPCTQNRGFFCAGVLQTVSGKTQWKEMQKVIITLVINSRLSSLSLSQTYLYYSSERDSIFGELFPAITESERIKCTVKGLLLSIWYRVKLCKTAIFGHLGLTGVFEIK